LTGNVEQPAFVQSTFEPFCKCEELAKVQENKQNEIPKFELPQLDNEGMLINDFVQIVRPKKALPALAIAKQTIETEQCH